MRSASGTSSQRGPVATSGNASQSCGISLTERWYSRSRVSDVKRFGDECRAGLRRAEELRPRVVARDDTLATYNALLVAASSSNAMAGLMSEVHPDEAIRDAAREVEQEVSRF